MQIQKVAFDRRGRRYPKEMQENHHSQSPERPTIGGMVPQEVVDYVIDFLGEDRNALKACALVCRDWLHRCRQHLHRSLTIYHQNCCIHPSQIPDVNRLLALPVVAAYTRELILEGKTDYAALRKTEAEIGHDGGAIFWHVVSQFSHVHSLRVKRLFWVTHSLNNKDRLCASFPYVAILDISMSDFVDAQEFLSFITGFPRLQRLKIERVFWSESAVHWFSTTGSDPSTYRHLPPDATPGANLQHLQVQHCDVHNMVDVARWLSSISAAKITSLYLSPPDGDDFTALPLYFRAVGASIEELFLTLEFATKGETLRQAVTGLEVCAKLRSLTLFANFGLGRKFVKAANIFWPCVLIVLDHVTSSRLCSIQFECQTEDLESSVLFQLDAVLSRPVFMALESVKFVVADSTDTDMVEVCKTLHATLPRTAGRGVLALR